VYGGGNTGLMGIVSGAVLEHENGRVVGVSPWAMVDVGGEKDKGDQPVATSEEVASAFQQVESVSGY